jgi:hypothetical protein
MNNQSLIIFAIGAFVTLIVTVAAVDQYLLDEHPPTEVSGLIWRIENAFSHVRDLEAVLEITREKQPDEPLRMLVRYLSGPIPAMSVRYLRPEAVKDERFVIQNDQLSHYLPQENLIVIKRWVGVPLAAVGLGQLDLAGLRDDWTAGRVRVEIVQDVPGFTENLFPAPVALTMTFAQPDHVASYFPSSLSTDLCPVAFSLCPELQATDVAPTVWDGLSSLGLATSMGSSYVLEVRDSRSDELMRMIWVDRETFLIRKVVVFEDGQRSTTLLIERIDIDQGLTEEEILTLPTRGVETIRG